MEPGAEERDKLPQFLESLPIPGPSGFPPDAHLALSSDVDRRPAFPHSDNTRLRCPSTLSDSEEQHALNLRMFYGVTARDAPIWCRNINIQFRRTEQSFVLSTRALSMYHYFSAQCS